MKNSFVFFLGSLSLGSTAYAASNTTPKVPAVVEAPKIKKFKPVKGELGHFKTPIKLAMVPASDSGEIAKGLEPFAKCLTGHTGFEFKTDVPNNYVVVIEGLGSKKVDIAFLNTFGYLQAHDKYNVKAILLPVRGGDKKYQGQIVVNADVQKKYNIKSVKDLNKRKIAYVDVNSTSGYILPKKLLDANGVKPDAETFARAHDAVINMVYSGAVDAGATYYNKPTVDPKTKKEILRDARARVQATHPDVDKKVVVLGLTEEIPNDPLVVRSDAKDFPAEKLESIKAALLECAVSNKQSLIGINSADSLAEVSDKDYDPLRKMIKDMNIDVIALNKAKGKEAKAKDEKKDEAKKK